MKPPRKETPRECVEAAIRSLWYGAHPLPSPHADDLEGFVKAGAFDAVPPIDMVLYCPKCGVQHIDKPNHDELSIRAAELGIDREGDRAYSDWLEENEWTNPPHRTHLCANPKCGCTWRPSDVATNGVASIKSKGENDSWPAQHNAEATAMPAVTRPGEGLASLDHAYVEREGCGEAGCDEGACGTLQCLPSRRGEVLGDGKPDWPEDLKTFKERKAYQRGVADARAHVPEGLNILGEAFTTRSVHEAVALLRAGGVTQEVIGQCVVLLQNALKEKANER